MGYGKNIGDIVLRFEKLLNLGNNEIDYTLHINPEQGVGFCSSNKKTQTAMSRIPKKDYEKIIDDLLAIAKEIPYGQGYDLLRDQARALI